MYRFFVSDHSIERRVTAIERFTVLINQIPTRIVVGEFSDPFTWASINFLGPFINECKRPICINNGDTNRAGFYDPFEKIPFLSKFNFNLFVIGDVLGCTT